MNSTPIELTDEQHSGVEVHLGIFNGDDKETTGTSKVPQSREVKYQIFVSSTFKDLERERKIAVSAILATGNFPIALENFTASDQKDRKFIADAIKGCDIVLLIIGHRYGDLMKVSDVTANDPLLAIFRDRKQMSFTEYEFRLALWYGKPIFAFRLTQHEIKDQRYSDDPLGPEATHTALYLEFLQDVKRVCVPAEWSKENPALFGIHVTDAIHKAMQQLSRAEQPSGWIRATPRSDRELAKSALKNDFVADAIRSLNSFSKLDKRLLTHEAEKKHAAQTFVRLFLEGVMSKQLRLFLESGSSVAYVAKELGSSDLKAAVGISEKGEPTIDIRTNNILAYLQLWLVDRVPCSTFPWGYPEGTYGGFFGPISGYGRKKEENAPPPVYKQDELRTSERQILPLVERMRAQQFSFRESDNALLVGAISGLQVSRVHKISERALGTHTDTQLITDVQDCFGPHVGSFFNKVFKRYMYSLRLPLIIMCDASKIDCEIDTQHCHFVFETAAWQAWINQNPVAFCIGCASEARTSSSGGNGQQAEALQGGNIDATTAESKTDVMRALEAMETLKFNTKRFPGDKATTVFAWNNAFTEQLVKMQVALPGLWAIP